MTKKIDLISLIHDLGPQFADIAAAGDASESFVAENYEALKQHKVFSALVPSEFGGGDATHSEICAFVRALAPYCPSTALALSMHQQLVSAALYNYRHGAPGQKVLEKVGAGEAVLVSTGANDWLGSNGQVEKVEGGYRVSAAKPFASGSPGGDLLVTSAPYEDPQEGWQVLHFPVPLASEGVSGADDWHTMGMRATGSQTVILDKVFVPEEAIALRRPRDAYHKAWNIILTAAMPIIMSTYLGVAEAAAKIARNQAVKRADDPATPYLLGELQNHLTTAELAVESMVGIANDLDYEPITENANAILTRKTIAANAVLATVEKALEAAGGGGFYQKAGLEKLVRDAHAVRYHPLQEKRQLLFAGRLALGLDPIRDEEAPRFQQAAE
jgi:alkylation response protein AidB-like acyl-CoA dehydrogenase